MSRKTEQDICPVDLYVKSRVLTDAINLSFIKNYTSQSILMLNLEVDSTFENLF